MMQTAVFCCALFSHHIPRSAWRFVFNFHHEIHFVGADQGKQMTDRNMPDALVGFCLTFIPILAPVRERPFVHIIFHTAPPDSHRPQPKPLSNALTVCDRCSGRPHVAVISFLVERSQVHSFLPFGHHEFRTLPGAVCNISIVR